MSYDPAQAKGPDGPYSEPERHALELADELRERVQREREVVRRLQEYLEHPPRR